MEPSNTRPATDYQISPTGPSSGKGQITTSTATGEDVQRVRNENTGTARDVHVIVALTVSLIGVSVAVAGSMFCLFRKR